MGITVGMVGVGAFAQSFIPLFKAHPSVDRIVLCDLDAEKLDSNVAKHGIVETASSLDDLCSSDVDAAVIITQNWLHAPQAIQALKAGKHVYSAVPAGITIDEIIRLVDTVKKTGRVYMLGETSYYYPAVIYCRSRHEEGDFGRIVYAEAEYYHDWCHGLYDVARWRGGNHWRDTAGIPPMYYPTHSISQILSVSGTHMTHVSCQGFVDDNEDGIYASGVNRWDNPFSNQTALFRMSDRSACRINEFRRIGHPGTVRMNLFGTEASFEQNEAGSVWLTRNHAEREDLRQTLDCSSQPKSVGNEQMETVTSNDATHLGVARIHPVERLPEEFIGLPNGHSGSHQFLVDDFVRACVTGTRPPNHVWDAARYTIPGIVAHRSAVQDGVLLDIPDLGPGPEAG